MVRHLRRVFQVEGVLLCLACLISSGWWNFSAARDVELAARWGEPLYLKHATATIMATGAVHNQALQLPYHWDPNNPGQAGEAVFDLSFDLAQAPSDFWALMLPKVGNAYEVWLNGVLLDHQGDLGRYNGADYSQRPRLINIMPGVLNTHNLLQVHIRADVGRRGGLAPPILGPIERVRALYFPRYLLTAPGVLAVSVFSLVVGLISLSLWVTQLGGSVSQKGVRLPLYLYAGVAEIAWCLGVGYTLFDEPFLPWPWWGLLPTQAMITWVAAMMMFCAETAGWGRHPLMGRIKWVLVVQWMLCSPMTYWALGLGAPMALTAFYFGMGILCACFATVFLWFALHQASWENRMVGAALLLNVVVGFRDIYVFRVHPDYGQITWLRYSSVLFGMALLYIVVTRFREASAQANELLHTLAVRVADRESELRASYDRLEQFVREQERSSERSRILRDMHDGVGAHISSAIRLVETGKADANEILATLRDSLDQLKLSIDAMGLQPGDVGGLLANLRYRLGPRFAASGLELTWQVAALPVLDRLDAQAMRQLQFIIFEAFSNILQHANATLMVVSANHGPEGVILAIQDNGVGFDVTQPFRRGCRQMQERAQAIGVRLAWSSGADGTRIEICLPP